MGIGETFVNLLLKAFRNFEYPTKMTKNQNRLHPRSYSILLLLITLLYCCYSCHKRSAYRPATSRRGAQHTDRPGRFCRPVSPASPSAEDPNRVVVAPSSTGCIFPKMEAKPGRRTACSPRMAFTATRSSGGLHPVRFYYAHLSNREAAALVKTGWTASWSSVRRRRQTWSEGALYRTRPPHDQDKHWLVPPTPQPPPLHHPDGI